jgi:nitrate reductase beta subunit
VEIGIPTVCSETCVGRLRYIGLMLYDVDAVSRAAAVERETDLYQAQRSVFLDPHDPAVVAAARAEGIAEDWIAAAQRSPIWDLIMKYEVALPLHPEYRTMPMVWYIPPLSPVVDVLRDTGHDGEDAGNLFGAVDALRIPIEYLAGLFTAGDTAPVRAVLHRLAAMRAYQRRNNLGEEPDESIAAAVGMTGAEMDAMYRLLAIAKYEERYVIPTAHAETAAGLEELATGCSLDYEGGPGMGGAGPFGDGPFGEASGKVVPIAVENMQMLTARQTADSMAAPEDRAARVNLLNWDGKGRPEGLFPPPPDTPEHPDAPEERAGS